MVVITAKTCAWKNVPKIDNEGAHGTAAFDDVRGDVVRVIEDDLMGNEFSNKWWGHVVVSGSKSLLMTCCNESEK